MKMDFDKILIKFEEILTKHNLFFSHKSSRLLLIRYLKMYDRGISLSKYSPLNSLVCADFELDNENDWEHENECAYCSHYAVSCTHDSQKFFEELEKILEVL